MQEQGGVAAEPVLQTKMQAINNQIDGVEHEMKENMKQILKRVEKLDNLVKKSKEMEEAAQHFTKTSREVACSYWWKNIKLIMVIVVVILIIVLIIILLATGVIPTSASMPPIVTPTSKP